MHKQLIHKLLEERYKSSVIFQKLEDRRFRYGDHGQEHLIHDGKTVLSGNNVYSYNMDLLEKLTYKIDKYNSPHVQISLIEWHVHGENISSLKILYENNFCKYYFNAPFLKEFRVSSRNRKIKDQFYVINIWKSWSMRKYKRKYKEDLCINN